jgi:hypothetical protein
MYKCIFMKLDNSIPNKNAIDIQIQFFLIIVIINSIKFKYFIE